MGSQAVVERLQRLGARRKASLGDEASGLCLKIGMIRYDTDIRSTFFFYMGILEEYNVIFIIYCNTVLYLRLLEPAL